MQGVIRDLSKIWGAGVFGEGEAATQANENAAQDGGGKLSLKTSEKLGFESLINRYYDGKLNRTDPIYLGKPSNVPDTLIDSEAPFIMTKADLDKSTRIAGNNKNYSAHSMDQRFIRSLPERINTAKISYRENRNGVDSFTYIVFNEFTKSLTAIGGERNTIYEGQQVNRIKSIYDIGTPEAFLAKEGKALTFTDKKAAKEILERARIQTSGLQAILDRGQILPNGKLSVKEESPAVVSPWNITLVNEITDPGKYQYLVEEFKRNGYSGRPVVAIGDENDSVALTGSHRILAARDAGIDIPVVLIPDNYDSNLLDNLKDAAGDEERVAAAKEMLDAGEIPRAVYELIEREDRLNWDNYDVPYDQQARFSLKDEEAVTDRELLANTLASLARNPAEERRLAQYKNRLDEFYETRDKLAEVENELRQARLLGDKKRIEEKRPNAAAQTYVPAHYSDVAADPVKESFASGARAWSSASLRSMVRSLVTVRPRG